GDIFFAVLATSVSNMGDSQCALVPGPDSNLLGNAAGACGSRSKWNVREIQCPATDGPAPDADWLVACTVVSPPYGQHGSFGLHYSGDTDSCPDAEAAETAVAIQEAVACPVDLQTAAQLWHSVMGYRPVGDARSAGRSGSGGS